LVQRAFSFIAQPFALDSATMSRQQQIFVNESEGSKGKSGVRTGDREPRIVVGKILQSPRSAVTGSMRLARRAGR
jgi:hypothetical protein